MTLTVDELTVWELAHRLAGENPYQRYWFKPIPPGVKDWCRTLLNEIIDLHLESSLITAKADGAEDQRFYIRTYLDEIYGCIAGGVYPKQFLQFVRVYRWDFQEWCQRASREPPEFWFGTQFRWPPDESDDPSWAESAAKLFAKDSETAKRFLEQALTQDKLQPKMRMRYEAMVRALDIWIEEPEKLKGHVAQQLWDEGFGEMQGKKKVELRTIESWIRKIAPENVKNTPGRRKKPSETGTKIEDGTKS